MFTTLHKFEDKDFFNANTEYELEIFGRKYRCENIYAAMIDYREYNFIKTKFSDDADFLDFINTALTTQARHKDSSYVPSADDTLVTLVTCVSSSIPDKPYKRWILVSRLAEELGEAEYPNAGMVGASAND